MSSVSRGPTPQPLDDLSEHRDLILIEESLSPPAAMRHDTAISPFPGPQRTWRDPKHASDDSNLEKLSLTYHVRASIHRQVLHRPGAL
jgi:hypothetical protein